MQAGRVVARLKTSSGSFCAALLACSLTSSLASLYSWNLVPCAADTVASSARLAFIASAYYLASLRSLSRGRVPGGMVMESCLRVLLDLNVIVGGFRWVFGNVFYANF